MLTFVIMPMKVIPLRIPNQMPAEAERHIQTTNYTTQNALNRFFKLLPYRLANNCRDLTTLQQYT